MIDVTRFINSLTAELQGSAWERGITLVVDASTPVMAPLPEKALRPAVAQLLKLLIQSLPERSSICLMTQFKPARFSSAPGKLNIEISWGHGEGRQLVASAAVRAATTTLLSPALTEIEQALTSCKGNLDAAKIHDKAHLSLLIPGATAATAPATKQKIAVIVDDDTDMQEFLSTALEQEGFRTIPVNDGIAALLAVDRYQPDLVLTDIVMPNLNGLDLINRIKSYDAKLPVIVFSGYVDTIAEHCRKLQNPPDAILPKPVAIDAMMQAIREVLTAKEHA